jgi:hypothetical protein
MEGGQCTGLVSSTVGSTQNNKMKHAHPQTVRRFVFVFLINYDFRIPGWITIRLSSFYGVTFWEVFFWAGGSLDAAHAASGLSLEGKHDEKLEWN